MEITSPHLEIFKLRNTVTIGFQVSYDDVHSVTGYCAAEMAFGEANNDPRFPFEIKLVPIIDRANPEVGKVAAKEFVKDPTAVGVLGPLNSDTALGSQEVYHDAGMPQLTSEASSPLLTRKGYDNFARLVANDEKQGRALAHVAVKHLKAKRIAVLHDDTAWGRPIAEIFSHEAEILGSKPVFFQGFGDKEKSLDFSYFVRSAVDSSPDLVYFAIYWNKAHIIAHRLRDSGVTAVFLGSDALKPYAFLEVPSLDRVKPFHSLAGVDIRVKPSAHSFFVRFAEKYPMMVDAPQYAGEAYDCAGILLEAIRRANSSSRSKILESFKGIKTFEGVTGKIQLDEKGDLASPEIGLYQCENGLRKYLGQINELVKS